MPKKVLQHTEYAQGNPCILIGVNDTMRGELPANASVLELITITSHVIVPRIKLTSN
jgi:hypothetical protein